MALAADLLLVIHVAFVLFVVSGPLLVLAGVPFGWRWTRNLGYRIAHLAGIGVVVAQAWLGLVCPLTRWEHDLRVAAGGTGYARSFIGHWLQRLLFYDAPSWVFTVVYTTFGALVLLTWWLAPPRRGGG